MSDKGDILHALHALQSAIEEAQNTLGRHEPQRGDPDDIATSKAEGWKRDYGPKMRSVLLAIKHLQSLTGPAIG
jgi:hypothetical protein